MPKQDQRGFSLVELMVALAFTGILMAGMGSVYKSSISAFATAGEKLSATRRGRIAIDVLSDDLNVAGMFLTTMNGVPQDPQFALSNANPGFWVNPDQPVTLSDGTLKYDEFYFYYDQVLPFQGSLVVNTPGTQNPGLQVLEGTNADASAAGARTVIIDTHDVSFAPMVAVGQYIYVLDQTTPRVIESITAVNGTRVTVVTKASTATASGGRPGTQGIGTTNDRDGVPIQVLIPAQMVKYSLQARAVDPADPAHTVPCLVREQGAYSGSAVGLPAAMVAQQQVIAEDVTGLKLFISVDGGRTWLRESAGAGWSGYQLKVNTALASGYGRPGQQTINDATWFREIPVTLRLDVTTRTAQQRSEYGTTGTSVTYKEKVSSFVMRPRHFGLSTKN